MVAECGSPAGTCFCTSMGTGPGVDDGFDLALTEIDDGEGHRFVARVGSDRGAEILRLPAVTASAADLEARAQMLGRAAAAVTRQLQTEGLAGLLARNLEHPRWDDVAERCLACGNCTLVCPTCFCSDVRDTTNLTGEVRRQRPWASCFDLDHSYLHGGPVRASTSSRYRQWMTHKLSTWWDQFGTSGCVGCGRCITWCPVGIDITEEAAAIRRSDGGAGEPAGPAPRRHEDDLAELLSTHPFLAGLPADAVATVAGCARNVVFEPGSLCVEGERADTFYLLRRGQVAIDVHAPGRGPSSSRRWVRAPSWAGAGWYRPTAGPSTPVPRDPSGPSPWTEPACGQGRGRSRPGLRPAEADLHGAAGSPAGDPYAPARPLRLTCAD